MTAGHPRLAGLAAAALVAAAGLVGLSGGPASAALCSGHGVNVVVDYHGLGGGVLKGCDTSGAGKTANKVFPAAGYPLTYVRGSGFVCRVNGKPASDPCQTTSPANAYWGLYWSDGKSGTWTYATSGVGGVSVPDGGFVAFSWQNGGADDPPGTSPVGVKPSPKPTPTPKPQPTTKPAKPTKATKKATTSAAATKASAPSSSASASANASAPASAKASASALPTASPSSASASVLPPTASDSASPDAATPTATQLASSEPDTGGLPPWVPGAVVVALGAATGGVLWWRRGGRRSGV